MIHNKFLWKHTVTVMLLLSNESCVKTWRDNGRHLDLSLPCKMQIACLKLMHYLSWIIMQRFNLDHQMQVCVYTDRYLSYVTNLFKEHTFCPSWFLRQGTYKLVDAYSFSKACPNGPRSFSKSLIIRQCLAQTVSLFF